MENDRKSALSNRRELAISPAQMQQLSETELSKENYDKKGTFTGRTLKSQNSWAGKLRHRIFNTLNPEEVGNSYDYELPICNYPELSPNPLQVSELIDLLVANNHTQEPIRIADFGYGKGFALLDAALTPEWQSKIELYGIGFSQRALDYDVRFEKKNISLHDLLIQNQVQLIEKSLTQFQSSDMPKVDVIMLCYVLQYFANYPQWEIIKKLYRSLNVGGVIVLNCFGFYMQDLKFKKDTLVQDDNQYTHAWKNYFKALENIGCHIDTYDYSRQPYHIGELAIYKKVEGDIPNIIGDIHRPSDHLFTSDTY